MSINCFNIQTLVHKVYIELNTHGCANFKKAKKMFDPANLVWVSLGAAVLCAAFIEYALSYRKRILALDN
jgi:hypothetical protein